MDGSENWDRPRAGLPDVTEPVVDLGVGETAALLAWTHYLLGAKLDAVHPMLGERIKLEIERRVLTPCLERDDFWWMGWHRDNRPVNNWNPWCCSNWLACVLLLETDADRRTRAVHKIMRILDLFLDHQPADGGCDEGPSYWARAAGSMFECLDLLHTATAGRIDIFGEPLIREMGLFVQRKAVVVTDDYQLSGAKTPAEFNFITSRPVDLSTPGQVRLGSFPEAAASRGAVLAYDAAHFSAAMDTVEVTDPWLKTSWARVYRVLLVERVAPVRARREFRLTAAQ